MDKDYAAARMRASLDMANKAADTKVRLVHLDLAGRYSVIAAGYMPPATSALSMG